MQGTGILWLRLNCLNSSILAVTRPDKGTPFDNPYGVLKPVNFGHNMGKAISHLPTANMENRLHTQVSVRHSRIRTESLRDTIALKLLNGDYLRGNVLSLRTMHDNPARDMDAEYPIR